MGDVERTIAAFVLAAAVGAGACAHPAARTQTAPTSLDVPAPPPRVVAPPDPEPPAPPAAREAQPQQPAKPAAGRPASGRDVRADAARAEKKPDAAPVAEVARPTQPPATLQQAVAAPGEVEKRVRAQLAQAGDDLGRVRYGGLNADERAQYDTAKRFIVQAEQALKERNFLFAEKVAEKAAGLAAVLAGR